MFLNLTKETCTGTGNTLTLAGATSGMNAFGKTGNGVDGALYSCVVDDADGTTHVAGIYTFNKTANTLTRNDTWNTTATVVNNNPATNIALSAGTHTVRCDITSSQRFDRVDNKTLPGSGYIDRVGTPDVALGTPSGTNTLRVCPIRVVVTSNVSTLSIRFSTAPVGTENFILGIYKLNPDFTTCELIATTLKILAPANTSPVAVPLATPVLLQSNQMYFTASIVDAPLLCYGSRNSSALPEGSGRRSLWNNNERSINSDTAVSAGWTTFPQTIDLSTFTLGDYRSVKLALS